MISTGTGDMFHDYLTWSISNFVPVEIFYWSISNIVPTEIFIGDIKDCSGRNFYNSVYIISYSLHKNDTICVICVFILIFAFL